MWWVVVGLVVAALVFLAIGLWFASIVVLVVAAVALPFRLITAVVDEETLTIRYAGPLAPVHRIERRDIGRVAVVADIRPRRWGGWGYRGSRRLFGRAAVLIRRGPGLEVATADGRSLVITVDDPEGAVAALTA